MAVDATSRTAYGMTRRAKIIHNGKGCDVTAGYRYVLVEESPTDLRPLRKSNSLDDLESLKRRGTKKDPTRLLFVADLREGTVLGAPKEEFDGDPNVWEKFEDDNHWRLGDKASIGRVSPRGGKPIFALKVPAITGRIQWFDTLKQAQEAVE